MLHSVKKKNTTNLPLPPSDEFPFAGKQSTVDHPLSKLLELLDQWLTFCLTVVLVL